MTSSMMMDAILYYSFHFIYLGHPPDILARLWVTEDLSNAANSAAGDLEDPLLNDMRSVQAWKVFDDSMRQSYKATGIIAGLVAAVISGLFSIDAYRSHTAVRAILLTSLTSSVFSASLCLSLLSTVYMNPLNIRHNWKSYGIVYIIILSGPSAWLSFALWTLQTAILAIVWLGEGVSAKVTVTTVIGLMFLLNVTTRLYTLPNNRRLTDFGLLLIGRKHGMSHHMVNLTEDSKKKRMEYIMRVYVCSPSASDNLEKPNDDDETRTQIVDDEEILNSNSKRQGSKGSLVQSAAAASKLQKANPGRGGSPMSLLELPSASGQASPSLISVGASFFHPYQGGNGPHTGRVSHSLRGGNKTTGAISEVQNQRSNLKKEESQGSTVVVTPATNSKLNGGKMPVGSTESQVSISLV